MVTECNYGGGLFLEFQPLTDCMLCEGVGHPHRLSSVIPIVDFTACGRCGVVLVSGCGDDQPYDLQNVCSGHGRSGLDHDPTQTPK